ncbi:MAG: polysaccharide biosynthesis protein [Hyphomonas sp.]|uniref:polysaccharide biosynthesis protein n=1 Tax=Hyphomonas sp. TaxID=87 RepID=UPI003527CC10
MTPQRAARRAIALTLGFDLAIAAAAMVLSNLIVWWVVENREPFEFLPALVSVLVFVLSAAVSIVVLKVHTQVWRHMGWPDAVRLAQAVALAGLVYLPFAAMFSRPLAEPWTVLLTALLLWTMSLFLGRMIALSRSTHQPLQIFTPVARNAQPVLLVGDATNCAAVIRRLQAPSQMQNLRILGLIDVEGNDPGRAIRGVPIFGGIGELANVIDVLTVRYGQTPWVAVTGKARRRKIMMQILEVASERGAAIMALNPDETAQVTERIRPADLLARPERMLDINPVRDLVEDSRVLVTGGGGTIGSELARQVAGLKPESLTILDSCEYNLYAIDLELRRAAPDVAFSTRLGDVRDASRVRDVFQSVQPQLVIHAAALKHVPLMERNVCEAILTNVAGAVNAARAAAAVGAKRFVFISTDKAVEPDNVMGATKRLAEIAISHITAETGMAAAMVRFGNVLGSSGSVVPLFEKQIAEGGPVTLTDMGVTRYFMTVEEASALVLQAAALQQEKSRSELYVLDMGEPMAILQLAETMIRLKGLVPGVDIQITETGLREGEKLHEALTYEHEAVMNTPVDGVLKVTSHPPSSELFDKQLAALIEAASRRDRSEALRLLGAMVPEYGERRGDKSFRHIA